MSMVFDGPVLHMSMDFDGRSWISMVDHQIPCSPWSFMVTISPGFEPMKDTDLKHVTLKTAFLLALASSKRHSKMHAWVANKVSNLGQWEKVALFPSSDFLAKNQLAREGSQSVSPVTIPALTTIVDRQFKEDRTAKIMRIPTIGLVFQS